MTHVLELIPSENAQIILSLAAMLTAGFLVTRITKLFRLPNVTGYIIAGILIGPWVLHVVPDQIMSGMDFVTDVALAFIAFGVGRYFKMSELKKNGPRVIVITLTESLTAGLFITLAMYFLFHYSMSFSLLLGAIGCATAPASTIMTIRQYHAKGEFVNTILEIVALDDAVALIAFSISAAYVAAESASQAGSATFSAIVLPLFYNLGGLLCGALLGFVLHWIADPEGRSADHRLALVIAMIFLLTGLCTSLNISPLLSCMVLGTVYINAGGNKKTFKLVSHFTPPILLLFFVLSGMRLNLPTLKTAGIVGVVYLFVRIAGKYLGAWYGCLLTKAPVSTRNYLGLALIPQAGVSIGLAVLGQRMLPADTGTLLTTIILSSGVLYEMVGPASAKAALFLAESIPADRAETPAKPARLPETSSAAAAPVSKSILKPVLPIAAKQSEAEQPKSEQSKAGGVAKAKQAAVSQKKIEKPAAADKSKQSADQEKKADKHAVSGKSKQSDSGREKQPSGKGKHSSGKKSKHASAVESA